MAVDSSDESHRATSILMDAYVLVLGGNCVLSTQDRALGRHGGECALVDRGELVGRYFRALHIFHCKARALSVRLANPTQRTK